MGKYFAVKTVDVTMPRPQLAAAVAEKERAVIS
jgi:hypothetical protein